EASCPWLPPVADCLSREVELPQELGRRPVETRLRHVADIAQVLSSHRSRVEPAGGDVAIEREEAGGIALGIRRPRNVTDLITDRVLVGRTELRERRPRTPCRFRLEPLEPVEHDPPVPLVARIGRAHPLIDELDHSRCRMGSRMWSAARQARARMVSVGFLSALDTNTAPSVMKRLGTFQV